MRLLIVSGLSGSGKSVALHMLEDMGWYCIDNIPAGLLNAFISHAVRSKSAIYERSAVGLDARNEWDEIASVPEMARELRRSGIDCEIIYLHADESMLLRRYGETRRRHPLSREGVALKGALAAELQLLEPITYSADLVIDTSRTSVHELREIIRGRLSLMFESFGFKHGIPAGVDFVFDARTLPNPYWEPALRALTGRDAAVVEYLEAQQPVQDLLADMIAFIERRIPLYQQNNRSYLTVAVGCTGGVHRSVFLVDRLAAHFRAHHPDTVARHGGLSNT
jgi:UPF0042 nucleotide-binding protein